MIFVEGQVQQSDKRLEALLIEGLDSGDPILLDAADWARIRAEVMERRSTG